jgi:hypothetical protein
MENQLFERKKNYFLNKYVYKLTLMCIHANLLRKLDTIWLNAVMLEIVWHMPQRLLATLLKIVQSIADLQPF